MRVPVISSDGRSASVDDSELADAMDQGFKLAPQSSHMPPANIPMAASHDSNTTPQALTATMAFNKGAFPFAKALTIGAGATGGGMGLWQGAGAPGVDTSPGSNQEQAGRTPPYPALSDAFDQTESKAFKDNPKTRAGAEAAGAFAGMAAGGGAGEARREATLAKLEDKIPLGRDVEKALSLGQATKDVAPLAGNMVGSTLPIPYGTHIGGAVGAKMAGLPVAAQGHLFGPYANLQRVLQSPAIANQFSRLTPAAGTAAGGLAPLLDIIRERQGK